MKYKILLLSSMIAASTSIFASNQINDYSSIPYKVSSYNQSQISEEEIKPSDVNIVIANLSQKTVTLYPDKLTTDNLNKMNNELEPFETTGKIPMSTGQFCVAHEKGTGLNYCRFMIEMECADGSVDKNYISVTMGENNDLTGFVRLCGHSPIPQTAELKRKGESYIFTINDNEMIRGIYSL